MHSVGRYSMAYVGWHGAVGIATCYRLDGPGIEPSWGQDFLHPSRQVLGSTQPPVQLVRGLFPASVAACTWR
jgi:hypothetical protein